MVVIVEFGTFEALVVDVILAMAAVGTGLLVAGAGRLGAVCDDCTSFAVGVAPMGFVFAVACEIAGFAATIFVMAIFWGATLLVGLRGALAVVCVWVAPASVTAFVEDLIGAVVVFAVVEGLAGGAVALLVGFWPETFAAALFLATGVVVIATDPVDFSDDV